jgi:hypothetical protein
MNASSKTGKQASATSRETISAPHSATAQQKLRADADIRPRHVAHTSTGR